MDVRNDAAIRTTSQLFRSFWHGGFEAACHINLAGVRRDMVRSTQHDRHVESDYRLLRDQHIQTVRESIRWHLVDRQGQLDFSTVAPFVQAARAQDIQVIWTLCHYGWPDDVDLLSPEFVDRFRTYAGAVARYLQAEQDGPALYAPINEISFFAWAAGAVGIFYPYMKDQGRLVKQQLIRATLAACDAIWEVDPQARMVHIDPIMHVTSPRDRPDLAQEAAEETAYQFEAWDMLGGYTHQELGGHPRYLDIIGVNFYFSNQWERNGGRLIWEENPRDERWVPLHELLGNVWNRYRRPLYIAETSHIGIGRGTWLAEITDEVLLAREAGTPVDAVCLYPVIDRHDWDNVDHWHNSGLWDFRHLPDGTHQRVLVEEYAEQLRRSQELLP